MHAGTILAVAKFGGERESQDIVDRSSAQERAALFLALDHGLQRHLRVDPPLDLLVRRAHHAHGRDRHPDHGTLVDNWYLWGEKHGIAPVYAAPAGQPPAAPPQVARDLAARLPPVVAR